MGPVSLRTIGELVVLADPAANVEKLFDWHFERHKLVIQGTAAFLGAFFAGLIAGALRGDFGDTGPEWIVVAIVALFVAAIMGGIMRRSYLLMKSMEDDFVPTLALIHRLTAP